MTNMTNSTDKKKYAVIYITRLFGSTGILAYTSAYDWNGN